jgi:hypothetical protein
VLIELASHNSDIKQLLERGYALAIDEGFLIVRDIPYLDENGTLQDGAIVTKLEYVDKYKVLQQDHQIYFAGSAPHGINGLPIPNLGGGPCALPLQRSDVVVQRSFSNKPMSGAYADFFEKIEQYVTLISGPAVEKFSANPFTFRIDSQAAQQSVFKYCDTLTSRAELADLTQSFREDVVAIIGLGGTGSYVLDFLSKTPVKEIRAFDADHYHVHNAYRSPGRLLQEELGKPKADVYQSRYEGFREGLSIKAWKIGSDSGDALEGVTFAFVCVDKGSSRKEIFDTLIGGKIPFIDVGMGLSRRGVGLSGMLRTTYFDEVSAEKTRARQLAEEVDVPGDEYRTKIQIAELNALNAALAVFKYKKVRGFYADDRRAYHSIFQIDDTRLFIEEEDGGN